MSVPFFTGFFYSYFAFQKGEEEEDNNDDEEEKKQEKKGKEGEGGGKYNKTMKKRGKDSVHN